MKLIQQTTLHYQDDRSDKVYEVDLCQVGEELYVVNFRYGRRGSHLKEGSKTDVPVPLSRAQTVFQKLVDEKVKKGYQDVSRGDGQKEETDGEQLPEIRVDHPQHQAILNRLRGEGNEKWPLERAIWRAGELGIKEATPLLIKLMGTDSSLQDYCIIWALGRCGDGEVTPFILPVYRHSQTPDFVARMALEVLLTLGNPTLKKQLIDEKLATLPLNFQELVTQGNVETITTELNAYLDSSEYQRFGILDTFYHLSLSFPVLHLVLQEIIRTAPLRPNYFKPIRHIFKLAEYRQDATMFGIISYRFATEKAMYRNDYWGVNVPNVGNFRHYEYRYNPETRRSETIHINEYKKEINREGSRLGYGETTRSYLLGRVWRTLRTLGKDGDPNYVKMAAGCLLEYTDENAQSPQKKVISRWSYNIHPYTQITKTFQWDRFAPYLTFNHILYERSPRYELLENRLAWRCREGYQPGDPEPLEREEAFPELWQQQPEVLLQLLLESRCHPVHNFAAKALKDCPEFCQEISQEILLRLLKKPYQVTVDLAGYLVLNRPDLLSLEHQELILALVNSCSEPIRQQVYQWIERQREEVLRDIQLITALLISQQSETRLFARHLLTTSILNDDQAKVLIGRFIAELLSFIDPQWREIARELSETLLLSFTPQLRTISLDVVLDLLHHPLVEVQELGGRILLNHEIPVINLPPSLLSSLLNSNEESIRVIGVRLFGQLPDEMLINSQPALIVSMVINPVGEIRQAIRSTIRRLVRVSSAFAETLLIALIEVLMLPEKQEGVHRDVVEILREDIPGWMEKVDREIAWRLLRSYSPPSQDLGASLLKLHVTDWRDHFATFEVIKLANHELVSVRESARQIFLHNLSKIRGNNTEMLSAVRMLESKWEDSREFALKIFRDELTDDDWTPEVMVYVCDSIREDVRQLGRELVKRTFEKTYGQDYLLKFSEHPSADMQLFATNYLETFAANSSEKLRELTPYFIRVLSRVNQGRIAKQRIFMFLDREAQKSQESAEIVAEILTRQSVTMAIGDKASAMEIMVKIHRLYPAISLPIQVKAVMKKC